MKTQINTSAASKAFGAGLQAAFCMSDFSILPRGFKLFMVFFLSCAPFFAKADSSVSSLIDELGDKTTEAQALIEALDESVVEAQTYCSEEACPTAYNETGYLALAELEYGLVLIEKWGETEEEREAKKANVAADIELKAAGRVIAVQQMISLRDRLQKAVNTAEQIIALLVEAQGLSVQAGAPKSLENYEKMRAALSPLSQ